MKMKNKKLNKGFTLIEMLVVVLIIGILAGIALPQYQMAVTKAKIASILPLMRRWKDAMYEYKLQHGDYLDGISTSEYGEYLGVSWPNDWKQPDNTPCGDSALCGDDYWTPCWANNMATGHVYCYHETSDGAFSITMYQPDDPLNENLRDKITCYGEGSEGLKICKALGGKLIDGDGEDWGEYSLN